MAKLHQLLGALGKRNVGFGLGEPLDWGIIKGCFLFDGPVSFTQEQLANLQETLQTLAWQDNAIGRCYPIGNFVNPADATEDPTIESFSDGSKAKVRDGVADWTFQFTAGGWSLLQALRTHNGNNTAYVLFYDKSNQILGCNLTGDLQTIPMQIFDAPPFKMNTGSNVSKYLVHFVFDIIYANDYGDFTQTDFALQSIVGLQDIKLIVNGFNHATGLVNVTLLTDSGGVNLYSEYSADFIAALWIAQNADTGLIIPITTITPLSGPQSFNVLLNTSSANYPTNSDIYLSLAAPSVMNAQGIEGFAGEQILLEVISS